MQSIVTVSSLATYDVDGIYANLPDEVFEQVRPGDTVILKPNWVMESHKYRPADWDYVITHPAVITAVLRRVLDRLNGSGRVIITDGPQTDASFNNLVLRYPVDLWRRLSEYQGVGLEVLDLRDYEWETCHGNVVKRKLLSGDPKGKVLFNLQGETSEFWGHNKSKRGYYGADCNIEETNKAHDGHNNLYRVSRSIIEADVFINLPKLKTHRKSGITCCLKNLVGINTYKNFLPHHSEGCPPEGGDQFATDNISARIEGPLMGMLKQHVLKNTVLARLLSPLNTLGKKVFGDTRQVVRSGNWYGNDTIWRMILDLNKILFYGNPDGTFRPDVPKKKKRYIGIVDAIFAGEGFGPLEPDRVEMGYLICGTNPVSIDWVCAELMGFNPINIPSIVRAFSVKHYKLAGFSQDQIEVILDGLSYTVEGIPSKYIIPFKAALGWKGHIEKAVLPQ